MNRIPAVLAIAFALAACQQVPSSKEPSGAAAASDAGRVQRANVMSSVALRGPSNAPARSGPYPAAIVKDLVIAASDRKNLRDEERNEFEAIKGELSGLFGDSFRDALQKAGYVESIVGDGAAGAVVIETTLTQLTAATNRGTMAGIHPGLMDFTVTVSDGAGKLLGSYQLHYEVALRLGSVPAMEVQRRVFPDAGGKVGQAIAKSR